MIRDHKFYEMQSALAAAGQLTDTELSELEQHAAVCASCRECIAEMAEVSLEFFLVQAAKMKYKGTPAGMQERFLERAVSAGIPFSQPGRTPFAPMFVRVAVVAVLLAISASLSWKCCRLRMRNEKQRWMNLNPSPLSPSLLKSRESTRCITYQCARHNPGGALLHDTTRFRSHLFMASRRHASPTSNPAGLSLPGTDQP